MAAAAETKLSADQRYRQAIGNTEPIIVDVVLPSGFVIKYQKPSKYEILFHSGRLPQAASSHAVDMWKDKGLIPEDMELTEDDTNNIKVAQTAYDVRDMVLELSHDPKLVVGTAHKDNELSTSSMTNEDLDYIFRWVAAGGDESLMLSRFSGMPRPDTLASASRPKQRNKSKSNGGG